MLPNSTNGARKSFAPLRYLHLLLDGALARLGFFGGVVSKRNVFACYFFTAPPAGFAAGRPLLRLRVQRDVDRLPVQPVEGVGAGIALLCFCDNYIVIITMHMLCRRRRLPEHSQRVGVV